VAICVIGLARATLINPSPQVVDKPVMENWGKALASIALAFIFTTVAHADRLILQDGRTIEGEVTGEDDNVVTIQVSGFESSLTQRISKSQIQTWYKPSREGQPYVVIPIFGGIGEDVTVDALRAGLAEARAAQPQYVILAIDSPGGNIGQMMDMIDALNDASKSMNIVAYVKTAYSAAAVIAMSCPQVYMKPGATIGATVPFRMTENGPADVDAKFRSVIEARMRAASEHAGHADLLIRGMSELDLEMYLANESGKPTLRTSGPGKLIKSKGQILTLTADEAVECGFARVAPTMIELGKQVCGGAWYEVNRKAYNTTIGTVAIQRQREREAVEQAKRSVAQRNAYAQVKPQLDSIERRMAELAARAVANQNAINDLNARCNLEIQQINAEYQQTVNNLPPYVQPRQPIFDRNTTSTDLANYNAWLRENAAQQERQRNAAIARAAEIANNRASAARQYLQANIAPLQADAQAAQIELGILRDKQQQLLASVPND
jgi:ATP-dependent protease ClpP protease subunit